MQTGRYILLPRDGVRSLRRGDDTLFRVYQRFNQGDSLSAEMFGAANRPFNVVDSANEDGAKLAEMDVATAEAINSSRSSVRALPEIIHPHPKDRLIVATRSAVSAAMPVIIRCEDATTGQPLPGQHVIAFTNFFARQGDESTTDAAGNALLHLSGGTIERLFVVPRNGYWGSFRAGIPVQPRITVGIEPLVPTYRDSIRTLYTPRFRASAGVRVGVLDTGCGPHADLNIGLGRCVVTGAPSSQWHDIEEHGTHVAGLIGGRGVSIPGAIGLSPDVVVHAYRVFDFIGNRLGTSNYAILKAMILAGVDQCDVINLSLGGGAFDPVVEEAVADARNQGMLVVVAAGNDDRAPVSYPAAYMGATAVSAMGNDTGFPAGSFFEGDVARPPFGAVDPHDFVASFSNIGIQIACTGMGVGVISTLPGGGFGPMSGTSMAAPMVAGCAASLLSNNPAIFGMARDRNRSAAIERMLQTQCVQRFGGGQYEGFGLPDPARV